MEANNHEREILSIICAGLLMLTCAALHGPAVADDTQSVFVLTSPVIADGDTLPAELKCTRDGGDGLSPPLAWQSVPAGTESLALIMHHYPRDRVEGKDEPSQYWLLWNIPADTRELPRGNPDSIGSEGSDKDGRQTGYTPPCSPPGPRHEYTITLHALDSAPDTLPARDDGQVDWSVLTQAIDGRVIASSSITFWN